MSKSQAGVYVDKILWTNVFCFSHWEDKNVETIKSLYYKRAVDGLEKKYKYVFTGTIPSSRSKLVSVMGEFQ